MAAACSAYSFVRMSGNAIQTESSVSLACVGRPTYWGEKPYTTKKMNEEL